MYFENDNDTVRDIITGKVKYRKCPYCNEKGKRFSSIPVVDDNYYSKPKVKWGNNYSVTRCRCCDGLGYVPK